MCPCAAAVAGGDCVDCGGYGHPCENAYGVTKAVVAVAVATKLILRSVHYDAVVAVVVVAGGLNDAPVLDLDPPPSRYQRCLPSCFTTG